MIEQPRFHASIPLTVLRHEGLGHVGSGMPEEHAPSVSRWHSGSAFRRALATCTADPLVCSMEIYRYTLRYS